MKFNDQILDAMLKAGLTTAFGGTGDEVTKVVTTVGGCDEANVILRRGGKDVGVLVIADDSVVDADEARARAQRILSNLQ